DSVSARPRLDPDNRALSRMQAEAPNCGQRPIGNRTRCRLTGPQTRADPFDPPCATSGNPLAMKAADGSHVARDCENGSFDPGCVLPITPHRSSEAAHDQGERDVPQFAWGAIRPRVLP